MARLANYMDFNMPNGYSSKAGQIINPFDPVNLTPEGFSPDSGAEVAADLSPSAMDAAIFFNASVSERRKKVSLNLHREYLTNKRIGAINGSNDKELIKQLKATGCEAIPVKWDEEEIHTEFILARDFKKDLGSHLKKHNTPVDSLSALIAFGRKDLDRGAKYGQGSIEDAEKTKDPDMAKVQEIVKSAQSRMDKEMEENSLDAIVFADRKGMLLSVTAGYPEINGFMGKSKDAHPKAPPLLPAAVKMKNF